MSRGRFVIRHTTVREAQKHDDVIFATNSMQTARAWLAMGEFIVWDRAGGQLLYSPTCIDWAIVLHPQEAA